MGSRVLLFTLGLLMTCAPARAVTIALLEPSSSSSKVTEALFRLQGELLAVGLEVEVRPRPLAPELDTAEGTARLEHLAAERGFDAIIDVVGGPRLVGVDIWITKDSKRGLRATSIRLEQSFPNAPETLAIRAIEVLRANLLVLDLGPRVHGTRSGEQAFQFDASPQSTEPGLRFGVSAGASMLTSLDGVGPALLPHVSLDLRWSRSFAVVGTLSGFGTRPLVETQAGGVRIAQDYALVGVRYSPAAPSMLEPLVSLGLGAMRTKLEGWADAPNRGHQVQKWALVVEGSMGVRLALCPTYYLTLAGHVQFTEPRLAIHFVDSKVASSGQPNLLVSLTMGAWL